VDAGVGSTSSTSSAPMVLLYLLARDDCEILLLVLARKTHNQKNKIVTDSRLILTEFVVNT